MEWWLRSMMRSPPRRASEPARERDKWTAGMACYCLTLWYANHTKPSESSLTSKGSHSSRGCKPGWRRCRSPRLASGKVQVKKQHLQLPLPPYTHTHTTVPFASSGHSSSPFLMIHREEGRGERTTSAPWQTISLSLYGNNRFCCHSEILFWQLAHTHTEWRQLSSYQSQWSSLSQSWHNCHCNFLYSRRGWRPDTVEANRYS